MPSSVASGLTYCSSVPLTRVRNSREPSVRMTSPGSRNTSISLTVGFGVKSTAPTGRVWPPPARTRRSARSAGRGRPRPGSGGATGACGRPAPSRPPALVEPPGHAAAGDPDRVAGDPQLVAGRDRRPPAVPAVAARVAEDARHLADRLALAGLRAGRRGAAGADVRLGVRIEHGERQPVGQRPVLARPPVAQARLVAGVQLAGRLRRPLQARRHRQPHGVVGRVHEPRHRQVGDVERLAALVEAVGLAVLGQPVGDLRPRDAEQVAQGVLVLVAVEPPQDRPALAGQGRPLRGDDRPRQALDEGLLPGRVGPGPALGRHLAGRHAVVHLDPDGQVGGILRVERQAGQVEPAFLVLGVVAARAVVADEGFVGRGRLGRTGRPGREQGQHREPEQPEAGPAPPIRK